MGNTENIISLFSDVAILGNRQNVPFQGVYFDVDRAVAYAIQESGGYMVRTRQWGKFNNVDPKYPFYSYSKRDFMNVCPWPIRPDVIEGKFENMVYDYVQMIPLVPTLSWVKDKYPTRVNRENVRTILATDTGQDIDGTMLVIPYFTMGANFTYYKPDGVPMTDIFGDIPVRVARDSRIPEAELEEMTPYLVNIVYMDESIAWLDVRKKISFGTRIGLFDTKGGYLDNPAEILDMDSYPKGSTKLYPLAIPNENYRNFRPVQINLEYFTRVMELFVGEKRIIIHTSCDTKTPVYIEGEREGLSKNTPITDALIGAINPVVRGS